MGKLRPRLAQAPAPRRTVGKGPSGTHTTQTRTHTSRARPPPSRGLGVSGSHRAPRSAPGRRHTASAGPHAARGRTSRWRAGTWQRAPPGGPAPGQDAQPWPVPAPGAGGSPTPQCAALLRRDPREGRGLRVSLGKRRQVHCSGRRGGQGMERDARGENGIRGLG